MKIYLSKINESWIVDRVRREWYENNSDVSSKYIYKSDIIWIIAPWLWKKIPKSQLLKKRVICSHYHFDFDNFDRKDFFELDQYVDEYHVISLKTKEQLKTLTDKSITSIPFWVNQNIFYEIKENHELRKELGFSHNDFLVGSFQRDTEGSDLKSPKLIKGPDIFFEKVLEIFKDNKNIKVVLAGKRRNYLIDRLTNANIPFKYFEMVDSNKLNKLYNILDLYIVSSRIEGGPQAILECSITNTPILSTDVGVASEILHKDSIFDETNFNNAITNTDYAYHNALKYTIPGGMKMFREMFEKFYEN